MLTFGPVYERRQERKKSNQCCYIFGCISHFPFCVHTHRLDRSRYLCAALTFSLPSVHFSVPRKPQVITQPMQVEYERCDMKSSCRVLAKGQLQLLGTN